MTPDSEQSQIARHGERIDNLTREVRVLEGKVDKVNDTVADLQKTQADGLSKMSTTLIFSTMGLAGVIIAALIALAVAPH